MQRLGEAMSAGDEAPTAEQETGGDAPMAEVKQEAPADEPEVKQEDAPPEEAKAAAEAVQPVETKVRAIGLLRSARSAPTSLPLTVENTYAD